MSDRNYDFSQDVNGYAFHPSFGGRTVMGKLEFQGGNLVFTHEDGWAALPVQGLELRLGGNNNEHLFFQHPGQPDWTVATTRLEILDHPSLDHDPTAARLRKAAGGTERRWRLALAGLAVMAGIFVALLVLVFLQRDRLIRMVTDKIPIEWEEKLGQGTYEQIKQEGKMLHDPELERQVRAVTDRLLPAVKASGYKFEFHILSDTNINAFAVPGGQVFILAGLLKTVTKPEELAGVLAHEMAHVTQRHSLRQMVGSAGTFLIVRALAGDMGGLSGALANGSRQLLQQKYSRDAERDADDHGWRYLVDAQVDPRGMIDFFRHLKHEEERPGGSKLPGALQMLSTHPATQERIDRLEAKLRELPAGTKFEPIQR